MSHKGKVKRDSLDDSAFMAFNISITTRLFSDISVMPKTEFRLRGLHGKGDSGGRLSAVVGEHRTADLRKL